MSDATAPPRAATEASVLLDPGDRAAGLVRHTLPVQLTSFVGRRPSSRRCRPLLTGEAAGHAHRRRWLGQDAAGGAGSRLGRLRGGRPACGGSSSRRSPARPGRQVAAAASASGEPGGDRCGRDGAAPGPSRAVCLDNCEHVVEACAEVAEALLRGVPELTVLTTSREPLGVPGEVVWRVPSLAEDAPCRCSPERAAAPAGRSRATGE